MGDGPTEQGIKLPVRKGRCSQDIQDADGIWILRVDSVESRDEVIQALNGYEKAVKFISAVDKETERCIAGAGDAGELVENLGDRAEQLLKHLGELHEKN